MSRGISRGEGRRSSSGRGPSSRGTPLVARLRAPRSLPVVLLELLEPVVVEAEVMADLVDDGVADQLLHLFAAVAVLLDGTLVDRDGVREDAAIEGVATGEVGAPVETVEGVGRLDLHLGERVVVGPVLDDDRHV